MIPDIQRMDWTRAWQEAQTRSKPDNPYRNAEFWDGRAKAFAGHQDHKSDYPEQFMDLLELKKDWSVLDVGCGPGTLALPLSEKVASVTAMDFSQGMLALLEEWIQEKRITNVVPVLGGWDDDWEALGITPHDVVVASRSLVSEDLKAMLVKLSRFATKKVVLSTMVNPGPFDPRIFEATGRVHRPGPDYIYVINQLYQMGIHARLDYTVHPVSRTYDGPEEALEESRWMVHDMTADEEDKLRRFFKDNLVRQGDQWLLPRKDPVCWAVISWDAADV